MAGISMKSTMLAVLACLFAAAAHAAPTPASVNTVKAGELVIDPPTLINLGFEWLVEGDDNRNAKVEIAYRKKGENAWKTGMPLLRMTGERVYQSDGVFNLKTPNISGSLFYPREDVPMKCACRWRSAAADKAAVIPNVTNDYSGNAPDLGRWNWVSLCPIMDPAPEAEGPERKSIIRKVHVQEA
jgi:hypothetical protein